MVHNDWIIAKKFLLTYELVPQSIPVLQLRRWDYQAIDKGKQNSPEMIQINFVCKDRMTVWEKVKWMRANKPKLSHEVHGFQLFIIKSCIDSIYDQIFWVKIVLWELRNASDNQPVLVGFCRLELVNNNTKFVALCFEGLKEKRMITGGIIGLNKSIYLVMLQSFQSSAVSFCIVDTKCWEKFKHLLLHLTAVCIKSWK